MENLNELLNQEIKLYQTFFDVLAKEQLAIEKRDSSSLEELTRNKLTITKLAMQMFEQRKALFGSNLKLVNGHNQLAETDEESWYKQEHFFCEHPQFSETWEKLKSLQQKCKHQNLVNGKLINLTKQSTERALNLIRGFDPDNNIYSAKGNRVNVSLSKSSVKA